MAVRQLDAGKVKEVDERLRDYRKLPTELIRAFRSTLEEASFADILIHNCR